MDGDAAWNSGAQTCPAVLLVGAGSAGNLAAELRRQEKKRLMVVSFLDDDPASSMRKWSPCGLGRIDDLPAMVQSLCGGRSWSCEDGAKILPPTNPASWLRLLQAERILPETRIVPGIMN